MRVAERSDGTRTTTTTTTAGDPSFLRVILSALRHPGQAHEPWFQVLLGTLVAAITAFLVVRWLLRFVQSHTFVIFGWYRVALGGVILGLLVF